MFAILKKLPRIYEKLLCYSLFLIITPCFFLFEMTVVRPVVVKHYSYGIVKHSIHIICPSFCFINILGNMVFSVFTDTSINRSFQIGDSYCDICKKNRPQMAWHCTLCNTCILRRDHHCYFFSRCIGLYNQRYFILYLAYIFISMVYSIIYNYLYVLTKMDEYDVIISVCRIINPFIRYLVPEPMGIKDVYVLFLMLNVGLIVWSAMLLNFHFRNAIRGLTAREFRAGRRVSWPVFKENFRNVFGTRWYFAMIWPLADSPLPKEFILRNI